jgi:hypothetical protein
MAVSTEAQEAQEAQEANVTASRRSAARKSIEQYRAANNPAEADDLADLEPNAADLSSEVVLEVRREVITCSDMRAERHRLRLN